MAKLSSFLWYICSFVNIILLYQQLFKVLNTIYRDSHISFFASVILKHTLCPHRLHVPVLHRQVTYTSSRKSFPSHSIRSSIHPVPTLSSGHRPPSSFILYSPSSLRIPVYPRFFRMRVRHHTGSLRATSSRTLPGYREAS